MIEGLSVQLDVAEGIAFDDVEQRLIAQLGKNLTAMFILLLPKNPLTQATARLGQSNRFQSEMSVSNAACTVYSGNAV